jgi:hypothetical protein
LGSGSVCFVFIAEGETDGVAPGIGVEGFDVFVLGDGDGLEHGLGEISQCGGDFGFDLSLGNGAKGPRQGNAEIAGGQQFCGKEAGNVLTDLLGGEGFGFFLGMEVAEMQMAGAARSAALATIGKGESAQTGTVYLRFDRRADFFLCERRAANRAIRGHRSLLKS